MREFLQSLSATEIFAFVPPGAIVLASISLWRSVDLSPLVGSQLANQPLAIAVLVLILAYALGMIVHSISTAGSDLYVHGRYRRSRIRRVVNGLLLWPAFRFHVPALDQLDVESRMQTLRYLEKKQFKRWGIPPMERVIRRGGYPDSMWEFQEAYRTLIAGRVPARDQSTFMEAMATHRRLLFALGVSFAFFVVSLQAVIRLGIHYIIYYAPRWESLDAFFIWADALFSISLPLLYAILVLGLLASFALRQVGTRLWQQELFLMDSLPAIRA